MAHSWGYAEHNGPNHWHTLFPVADGDFQSPIDIRTKEATFDATLQPLTVNYDSSSAQKLHNNGQSFNIEFDDSQDKSVLSGGPLPGVYRLKQMHMHWGSSDDHGSEHTVDGRTSSTELHLGHWNAKYGSFDEASKHKNGFGVIALFLEVGDTNPGLQKVIDALSLIPNKMAKLRGLYFNSEKETPCPMVNNYRPPQPLKGRKVRASFQ